MLIATAPIALPINTANPPTEAVASETARKTPIPEPTTTAENPGTKSSLDTGEQQKSTINISDEAIESQQEGGDENSADDDSQQEQSASEEISNQERRAEEQQQQEVEALQRRDREVRAHEQAHAAVGGSLAGAPQFTFKTGPDGKRYAVAGEVSIDISKEATPEATLRKAEQVKRAALAPAEPSGQDRAVAAKADQLANQARIEIREQALVEESSETSNQEPQEPENETQASFSSSFRERFLNSQPNSLATVFSQARVASSRLNQRILSSGALDEPNQVNRFSASV